jgi:hypothetical protein
MSSQATRLGFSATRAIAVAWLPATVNVTYIEGKNSLNWNRVWLGKPFWEPFGVVRKKRSQRG